MKKIKRTIPICMLLLVLAVCVSLLSTQGKAATMAGSGTEADPYVITSSSQFDELDGSSDYFVLGEDISVDGASVYDMRFSGVLDGNGHTVTYSYYNDYCRSLAMFSTNSGTIQNLRVELNVDCRFYDKKGTITSICTTNSGTISNCVIVADARFTQFCTSYKGSTIYGICVTNDNTISNCTVMGRLACSTSSRYADTASYGICGTNNGTITGCVNKATGGGEASAGICATNNGTVSRCIMAGRASASDTHSGYAATAGICRSNNGTVENCINFAELYVYGYSGYYASTYTYGIAGGDGTVKNCISAGSEEVGSGERYHTGYRISEKSTNCYDIGDLKLGTSGKGLVITETYTEADFPGLDFDSVWEITDYGIPCLQGVGSKLEGAEITGDTTAYAGKTAELSVRLLPETAVLYSFSYSADNCEMTDSHSFADCCDNVSLTPSQAGATRLTVTDSVAGTLAFSNINVKVPASEIVISGDTQVDVNGQVQLTATVLPEDATDRLVTWRCDTGYYAEVDENGLVTGIAPGTAKIVATSADGFVTATYQLQVIQRPESVTLDPTEVLLYPGQTATINATVLPANTSDPSLNWATNNSKVATVSDGVITAHSAGTAQILVTAKTGTCYAYCDVTVGVPATAVTISGSDTVGVGESIQLSASISPYNVTENKVTWTEMCDPGFELVSIDENGVVTGLKGGYTVIQATTADGFATAYKEIQVIRHPEAVSFDSEELFLVVNTSQTLNVSVLPEDTTDKTVTLKSSDNSIAMPYNGMVMGRSTGTAVITATTADGGLTAQITVHVYKPATGLTLTESDITVCKGNSYQVEGTVEPADATYQNLKLSSTSSILQFDGQTITALRTGTAVVKVSTARDEVSQTLLVSVSEHTYNNDGVLCDNCGMPKNVVSVEVSQLPEKTAYVHCVEDLELTGAKLLVKFEGGLEWTLDITEDMVSGFDNSQLGENLLTVTYREKTATFPVEIIKATVTFLNEDGTVLDSSQYAYGETVKAPANPEKAADKTYSYTFSGWDKAVTVCRGNAVYTATYEAHYIEYTVTFKNPDGTLVAQQTYHYGNAVTAPETAAMEADETYTYSFTGWDRDISKCTENTEYTAVYQANYIDYTVTFYNCDGTLLSQAVYHYGDSVAVPSEPEKPAGVDETFVFKGWDKTVTTCQGNTEYTAVFALPYPVGDYNQDMQVTNEDVVYLLWHTLFAEDYPIESRGDFTNDGAVTNEDVVYLLWHTLFPEDYPL